MSRFSSPEPFCSLGSIRCLGAQKGSLCQASHTKSMLNINSYINSIDSQLKKIGPYSFKYQDQIGKGYSSRVYKALHNQNQQFYAIKVIETNKLSKTNIIMLQNQIKILKTLRHSNVIQCYDIFRSKSHCYIVTELCQDGSLLDHMDQFAKLSEAEAINIIRQVIKGVSYLHNELGVIHRDLKPANILKNGQQWKIADFGFALVSKEQIKTKQNVGTPLYMPLQSLLHNFYSQKSDIFSVGVIFYELLCGVTPWESRSEKQLIQKMTMMPFQISKKTKVNLATQQLLNRMCSISTSSRITSTQLSCIDFQNLSANNNTKSSQMIPNPQQYQIQRRKIKKNLEQTGQRKLLQNKSMDNLMGKKKFKQHCSREKYTKKDDLDKKIAKPNSSIKNSLTFFEASSYLNKDSKNSQLQMKGLKSSVSYQILIPEKKVIGENKRGQFKKKTTFKSMIQCQSLCPIPQKEINQQKTFNITQCSRPNNQYKNVHKNSHTSTNDEDKISSELRSTERENHRKKKYAQNAHVIVNQIHFCRFLYYLQRNIGFILLEQDQKQKLIVLLFKIIKKVLGKLQNLPKKNTLGLQCYEEFKKTAKFENIKKTINEYSLRYQKEYLYLIEKEVITLEGIYTIKIQQKNMLKENEELNTAKFLEYMSKKCIQFLNQNLKRLQEVIDSHARNSKPKQLTNKMVIANIQGLRNLCQLYRLVKLRIKHLKSPQQFQRSSQIIINTNFADNNIQICEEFKRLKQFINEL